MALCGSTVPTEVVIAKRMLLSIKKGNTMLKDALKYLICETDVKVTMPKLLAGWTRKLLGVS